MNPFHSSAPMDNRTMSSPSDFPSPSPAKISDPSRTVLVVDEDAEVRQLMAQLLTTQGYRVLQAEDSAEALRLSGATATIHLLLTEFSMPAGDGLDLTREFRRVHPQTPVLMVSGSTSPRLGHLEGLDNFELLNKPFSFAELFHKVRAAMDAVAPLPRRTP